jgi:4-alpha-glucanotransferase
VSLSADLAALARLHGIALVYEDVEGNRQEADTDVVVALLHALGVPLASSGAAGKVLREQRQAQSRRHLETVLVYWLERPAAVVATLPPTADEGDVWLTLELEDGDVQRAPLAQVVAAGTRPRLSDATDQRVELRLDLTALAVGPIPPGRHHLTLEGLGAPDSALLLAAPTSPPPARRLGAFIPVHAIRSEHDWGIGTYSDLERLGEWASACGVDLLGTLPLYPSFLDAPRADPSPYLPVSRLAYNEIYLDPVALPEFAACPEARQRWAASADRIAALHSSPLVPYEEVAQLIRAALEPMARCAAEGQLPERRAGLEAFAQRHPELEAYARYRARDEGRRRGGEPDPAVTTYYLYCQWAAQEQLAAATQSCPHYADFPVGSHPHGFDPEWSPVSFVAGVHGGAPPDRFFPLGQDWGFRPLHPQRIREDEYRFLSAALARVFRHAACVRLDHVMGLQRLFMIPEGAPGGAYVSYAVEELHALVALEAHRHGTVVVGEDLGTVPEGVRPRMERDRMLRTWVFEFETSEACPLPDPPVLSLAGLDTHDLPRFAAYLWGDDVSEREDLGVITAAEAVAELAARTLWRAQLLLQLGLAQDGDIEKTTTAALEGCLTHLARSEAAITVADLEDLWGERERQNVPGTGPEAKNWRRRSARTLEDLRDDDQATGVLGALVQARAS